MRHRAPAVVVTLLLVSSGCSADEPRAPSSPAPAPVLEPDVPVDPDAPAPPPLPDGAGEPTDLGAEAFVPYFWAVMDFSRRFGSTTTLRSLADPGCGACLEEITAVDADAEAGTRIRGGEHATSGVDTQSLDTAGVAGSESGVARVDLTLTSARQVREVGRYRVVVPGRVVDATVTLRYADGAWRVADWSLG